MYAKRFAAIVMIHEGYSLYRIGRTLKLSPATAKTIKFRYDNDRYKHIVATLKGNKPNYLAIIELIDSILTVGGIMPRYGKSHMYKKYQK